MLNKNEEETKPDNSINKYRIYTDVEGSYCAEDVFGNFYQMKVEGENNLEYSKAKKLPNGFDFSVVLNDEEIENSALKILGLDYLSLEISRGENLSDEEIKQRANAFSTVFEPIVKKGGKIGDVVGKKLMFKLPLKPIPIEESDSDAVEQNSEKLKQDIEALALPENYLFLLTGKAFESDEKSKNPGVRSVLVYNLPFPNNSKICVQAKNGKFIIYGKRDDGYPFKEIVDELPKEFTTTTYLEPNDIDDLNFHFLGAIEIEIDKAVSGESVEAVRKKVLNTINTISDLLMNDWNVIRFEGEELILDTALKYYDENHKECS